MLGSENNRMEMDGPIRSKTIKELLRDDRKIVSYIFMTCCIKVLENDYGFSEEDVLEFNERLQEEIKAYKG